MDTVEFLEERKRMFKNNKPVPDLDIDTTYDSEKVVKFVEAWSAAHPRKTRQSVFLEQYPDASLDDRGVLRVCPADAYGNKVCPKNGENVRMLCRNCRREFWPQEME